MRPSIKRSLTGLLIVGALALSAVGADAMGGANGPDAYIGIVGGHPGYGYSAAGAGYKSGGYQGDGYQANTSRQRGHGWHGVNGWNYQGY
jgi:hypothetical protein